MDNVAETLVSLLDHGGHTLGSVTRRQCPELGLLTAIYARDPEGNIIEIQNWGRA